MIGNGKRAVYVDDAMMMRKVIGKKIEELGFVVDTCESAEELFALMNTQKYDIIFLDDMMPVMSGTEAMKKLKSEGCTIPIVVITGNEGDNDRDNYINAGFDQYIGKSKINELESLISGLLK